MGAFYNNLFAHFYVRFAILLTHGKHLNDNIILLRRKVWTDKNSLNPPLFIEVPVYQARKVSGHVFFCRVSILPLSTIFLLEFETVPTLWYFFLFFILHIMLYLEEKSQRKSTFVA